jgi:small multidrug resistance pump
MSWIYLLLAIVTEVSGTTCMKVSEGFTRILPSALIFLFYGLSLTFLTLTLKKIEVSVAYAVWSAVGTALIALIGIIWFRETLNLLKVASLALIILGVVGLHLSQGQEARGAPLSVEAGENISVSE